MFRQCSLVILKKHLNYNVGCPLGMIYHISIGVNSKMYNVFKGFPKRLCCKEIRLLIICGKKIGNMRK